AWTAENGELQSADMGAYPGVSELVLTDLPKGKLTMDLKVMSDGFDYLLILVNGELYDSTNQLLDYKQIQIDLYKASNTITFEYVNHPFSSGIYSAQAFVRNINMSVSTDNTGDTGNTGTNFNKKSSSGGSLSIGLLVLMAAGSFVRRKKR
ncbi:MAG: GlyGly-CTERM sorting domain-containing protein, partial [Pseudomonadota bacterium]|nr:GlyGly-CTERM sorting domain-containing protein [Pseudomonadota bacterium]